MFNPYSKCGSNKRIIKKSRKELSKINNDECRIISLVDVKNPKKFIENLNHKDNVVILGGDGTLNHIANFIYGRDNLPNIYLMQAGSGNDFKRSIKTRKKFIKINKYLENLPKVSFSKNNKEKDIRFLNSCGLGYDGIICKMVNTLRKKKSRINYFNLTINCGRRFKHFNLDIKADGKNYKFNNCWLVTAMNGSYFGGGIKVAPNQDRLKSKTLDICILHNFSFAKGLFIFPLMYLGLHKKIKKHFTIIKAKDILIKTDRKLLIEIDGETDFILNEIRVRK